MNANSTKQKLLPHTFNKQKESFTHSKFVQKAAQVPIIVAFDALQTQTAGGFDVRVWVGVFPS